MKRGDISYGNEWVSVEKGRITVCRFCEEVSGIRRGIVKRG